MDHADEIDDGCGGGGLKTTFLLSMAMPIINLPIERILKKKKASYVDDSDIVSELTASLSSSSKNTLEKSPFFTGEAWSWVQLPEENLFNISKGLPPVVAGMLREENASRRANEMPAAQFVSILRNALAHGGIIYLNEEGDSTDRERTAQLAFVSGKYDRNDREKLTGLNILKVREEDFLSFLQAWIRFISDNGAFINGLYAPEVA